MEIPSFQSIPTPLPPMLPAMVGVPEKSRFFAICYYGSKATWSDGLQMGTFSFYGVYEPLIDHIAVQYYLRGCDLGSDESEPTHKILCDRTDEKMYVGQCDRVEQFLKLPHPTVESRSVTKEELKQMQEWLITEMRTWTQDDYNRIGMFEMFGRLSPQLRVQRLELIRWLDQQISKDLLHQWHNRN